MNSNNVEIMGMGPNIVKINLDRLGRMKVVMTQENYGRRSSINQILKDAGWCYMCRVRNVNGILQVGVPNI